MQRRQLLAAGSAFALGAFAAGAAHAQGSWPDRPIRFIVPFPSGGGTDISSRLVAEKLTTANKWVVVVDNKPGAAGNIGLDAVAKAAPDGYTLGMGQATNLAINPSLYSKLPFDPLKDFTAIAQVATQPIVIAVRNESLWRTLADFLKAAKEKPGAVGLAQAGNGTVGHLAGELLARRAGVTVLQVPYKGAGPAMTDLLGGQVDVYFGSSVSVMPQLKGGKVRALAVTSAQRLPALPQVPTVAESGYPGFDASTWLGVVGPAGLPADIVTRLNTEIVKLVKTKDVQEKLAFEGAIPITGSPKQCDAQIRAEHAKWGALIREAKIKLD
ncbi:MAG: hypothetical protein GAK38_01860 [Xylophilus sp.]|nr:tripartite tricarboxylate transporter substrate binding protein [Xylophilus sp.]KAF1047509.1 MAG: hypothetical protein GAK38_01860 [Xylophilus sp.]